MTGMQGMLFPPLDEGSSHNGEAGNDEVLPQELQDRFATVRSLLREKAVENNNHNNGNDADSSAASAAGELKRKQQEAALEAARAVHDEMARLQNGIAELEAMYAAQRREQHVLASDDEDGGEDDLLESDVDEEDDGVILGYGNHHYNHAPPGVLFPALPSFANAVEPDVDIEEFSNHSKSKSNDNQHQQRRRDEEPVVTSENILCKS